MKKQLLLQSLFAFLIILLLSTSVKAQRRYRVVALMKSGDKYSGELKASTRDTLNLLQSGRLVSLSTAAISTIRIRPKGAIGRATGIGAGIGCIVGGIIGFASYKPVDCSNSVFCIDFGPEYDATEGAFLGGVTGGLLGLAVGSANKEIKIEGNASQMDVFNNEFKPKR